MVKVFHKNVSLSFSLHRASVQIRMRIYIKGKCDVLLTSTVFNENWPSNLAVNRETHTLRSSINLIAFPYPNKLTNAITFVELLQI
jgi:hypothetical protein